MLYDTSAEPVSRHSATRFFLSLWNIRLYRSHSHSGLFRKDAIKARSSERASAPRRSLEHLSSDGGAVIFEGLAFHITFSGK
jgi:hypothetical protein